MYNTLLWASFVALEDKKKRKERVCTMAATPQCSMDAAAAFCLFIILTTTATITTTTCSVHAREATVGCVASERAALLSFRAGITSDPAKLLASWEGQDCCQWSGVRCSNRTGHVVKLKLRNTFFLYDLLGEVIASSSHALGGQISSSLLALQNLKYLDLSGNSLGGAGVPIPQFLGSLKCLTYLNLSCMDFDGRIPPQLGNLSKLLYLDLSSKYSLTNYAMYSTDISWLPHLSSLKHLDMSRLGLGKIVDWVHVVNMLPYLRVLRLSGCGIKSTSTLALLHHNLTVLETLDLSHNSIYGPLPDGLGNMTSLEVLSLDDNDIKGMIPSTLKNLCNLKVLSLSENNIGEDITELMERLPQCAWNKLQQLHLSGANMIGNLPIWVGNLTALNILSLSHNQLTGLVPLGIGALTDLTLLDLSNNNLSGAVSEDHLDGLASLEFIALSYNSLKIVVDSNWAPLFRLKSAYFGSCQMGPGFPTWLKLQKDMVSIDISNTGIIDRIPDWFWTVFSNAALLDMSRNQISGKLPSSMEFMAVRDLHLGSNQLTGLIPKLPRNLEVLDISRNSLYGPLSSNFGAPQLQVVILFSNYITGSIPTSICEWKKLRTLDLSNNLLVGEFPRCGAKDMEQWNLVGNNSSVVNPRFETSASLGMFALILFNNNLSGEFPLFLQSCKNLTFLDLAYNRFSGRLPAWIGEKLPSLGIIRLRSNMFSGYIPIEIMKLEDLRYLDLAYNNLFGIIPQSLVNLKAMTRTTPAPWDDPFEDVYEKSIGSYFTYSGWSDDNLSVVTKGQELAFGSGLKYLVSIDFSCNNLSGQIPEEICSLVGLTNLNLSWNLLSGNITDGIGSLQSLESLDLSNNQLSGGIPSSLSELTSLSYLNLSYNNLSGRIPSGHQLDTLKTDDPASMYIGNADLCGYPLPKNCSGNEAAQGDPVRVHEDDSTLMYLYLGLSVGYAVGLWMVFCAFLFKKTWRIAYFRLFDKLYDRMYVFAVVTWASWFRKTTTN